jgi:hypothetical protein
MTKTDLQHLLRASGRIAPLSLPERAAFWEERVLMHVKTSSACSTRRPSRHACASTEGQAGDRTAVFHCGGTRRPPDDLAFASAGEIATRVRRRELSPFELRARSWSAPTRSGRSTPSSRCGLKLSCAKRRQLETRLQSGEDLALSAGVPVAIKDLMQVRAISSPAARGHCRGMNRTATPKWSRSFVPLAR